MKEISKRNFYITSFIFSVIIIFFGNMQLRTYLMWLPLILIIWLAALFLMKRLKVEKVFLKILFINVLWLLYTLPFTFSVLRPDIHIKAVLETLLYVLGLTIIISYITNRRSLFNVLIFLVNVYVFVSLLMLVLQIVGIYNDGGAFSSLYSNRNVFAFMSLVFLAIILNMPKSIRNRNKKKQIVMLIVFIMMTGSTKGLLGILIIFSIYMFFNYKLSNGVPLLVLFFAVFSGLLMIFNDSTERLMKKVNVLENYDVTYTAENIGNDSGAIRMVLAIDAINIFLEHKLKGVGVNNGQYYLTLPKAFRSQMNSINSQNNITEMLLNAGIPGFLLYYFPLIYLLYKSSRSKTKHKEIKVMIITLITLKLSMDIGMKSYNDAAHVFSIILVWSLFYRYIKNDVSPYKIQNKNK